MQLQNDVMRGQIKKIQDASICSFSRLPAWPISPSWIDDTISSGGRHHTDDVLSLDLVVVNYNCYFLLSFYNVCKQARLINEIYVVHLYELYFELLF